MDNRIFSVFGRINMVELFDEWEKEEVSDVYTDPTSGWQLKHGYVFENDVCALLFENAQGEETAYYRVLFYRGENESFSLVKKIRFCETGSFRVKAIGINRDITALFVCRFSGKADRDMYCTPLDSPEIHIDGDGLAASVLKQSACRFAVIDGTTVIFVRVPEGGFLEYTDSDSCDFLDELSKGSAGETEDAADDEDFEDDDDDEDEDDEDKGEEKDDAAARGGEKEQEVSGGRTAADELNDLIGLDNIKEKIRQITAFAKLRKMAEAQGRKVEGINLNLSFLGNPGTAKTTVARLFARIMKENGILSRGNLIEVGRSDLVAKYVGQTALKVKDVFDRAAGNVLFIDEAYSLVDSWENEYGDEAIATIVQEMENHRDDMIVIFAGYPDKMEAFLSRNPGLRSRVPFVVEFKDYTADELTAIAKSEALRRGYGIGAGAEQKIHDICTSAMKAEEFGNGRFSRNLVEAAIMRSASRAMSSFDAGADLMACFTLESCDFAAPDNMKKEEKTRTIGFSEAVAGIAEQFNGYVQNVSKLAVSVAASGIYSSTIAAYKTTILGATYTGASFTSGLLTESGSVNISVTVTDSRGRSASTTRTITVLAYAAPQITTFSAFRSDASGNPNYDGTNLKITVNFNIAPVNNLNGKYYEILYKVKGAESWAGTIASGNIYSRNESFVTSGIDFSGDLAYELRLNLYDTFKSAYALLDIPTAFTLFDCRSTGKGIAFGKVSEADRMEIAMDVELTGKLLQENRQTPTLLNSWVNYGAAYESACYWKDKCGVVHLAGLIKSGTTTAETVIFTLPTGYRPQTSEKFFAVSVNAICVIDVYATGNVAIKTGANAGWLSLSGISFRTD